MERLKKIGGLYILKKKMGNEPSKENSNKPSAPDSQQPHRKATRGIAFHEWVEQISRPVASSPVSSSTRFGTRGKSPARGSVTKNTRSNTNPVVEMANTIQVMQRERNKAYAILEVQEKNLNDLKEREQTLSAKKTRNAAENTQLKEIRDEIAFLERNRPDLLKKVEEISEALNRAELQSKWSLAGISEAIMTTGRLFNFSPAPDEKSAGEWQYVIELTLNFFMVLIPVLVATLLHLKQLDRSADDYRKSTENTTILAATGVILTPPACMLINKFTPLSLNRQRVLMLVAVGLYYGVFAYVATMMAKGMQIALCRVGDVGCVDELDLTKTVANKSGVVVENNDKDKMNSAIDIKAYINVLREKLMGPDSEFVFSLLCAATGAVDSFLTSIKKEVCSAFEKGVIDALKKSWDDEVAGNIFNILKVQRIQNLIEEQRVTNYNADRAEHGFFIDIDLGNRLERKVFVSTSNSESAIRFLWFLRYINSAISKRVLNCTNDETLGRGDPYGIAASILRSLFNDESYNTYIATQILNGKNPSRRDTRVDSIVHYMQKYPGNREQTMDATTKTRAVTLIKNAKLLSEKAL
jgi:hypothetical protein